MAEEVFPWLKSLPLAPEYHPTLTEFQDPISYILKIEEEASKYGICKIIPPVSASPKETVISTLNRSLSSQNRQKSPTFKTRKQQIGFCKSQQDPVQKPVWQSGESYTLSRFERKANNFKNNYLKKRSIQKKGLTDLELESLYWKAQVGKPFTVEYGNDMCCSAFDQGDGGNGGSEWNIGKVSRAKGSLLKYLKEEIEGVNTPMVYVGMMFSWFAWHCEDHDLHSLNYMHMGAGKTWYGIPKDAAVAFEDVIRTHGYGGEISPLVTFATLVGKTTIMSPEVLLKAGVPCFRLVQNSGEFVVTFPRAYHSGFSHGFNCAEATNIATPRWLEVAQEAAVRRASINHPPMMSHSQLLYDLALSFAASVPATTRPEPQCSRLKERLHDDVEFLVKRLFIQDIIQNNKLINLLGNEFPVTVLFEDSLDVFVNSLGSSSGSTSNASLNFDGVFSCVSCGIPCHTCVAVVQPTEVAARYLMFADLLDFNQDSDVLDPEPCSEERIPKITSRIGAQNVSSALGLLATTYDDSSDTEEEYDQTDSKSNKFVIESNCSMGRFVYQIQDSLAQKEGSSRRHIFCLQHAREVEQRLCSVGGVRILLFCHQDYPNLNDEARLMMEELEMPDHMWADIGFKHINKHDMMMIKSALVDQKSTYGDQDWAVKLGVDISFAARLCQTRLYRKQMPYNAVIYKTFCHSFASNNPIKPKTSRQAGRKRTL